MRPPLLAVLVVALAVPAAGAADPVAEARRLYNLGQYEAAERAAREAVGTPPFAEAGRVVLGRIQLERYRQTADPEDLSAARQSLTMVDPRGLDTRERTELIVGLAEGLYLEDRFGAAAQLFESVLDRPVASGTSVGSGAAVKPASVSSTVAMLDAGARERVLDWWATAVDRQAQTRPPEERPALYEGVMRRMRDEIAVSPGSNAANYWLAAAGRGSGNLEAAWDAALAGWVRAALADDRGAALRADLDRLVVQAIIPERAAKLAGRGDTKQAQAGMLSEWEAYKMAWSK